MNKIIKNIAIIAGTVLALGGCMHACRPSEKDMTLDLSLKAEKLSFVGQFASFTTNGIRYNCHDVKNNRIISFFDNNIDGSLDGVIVFNMYREKYLTNSVDLVKWQEVYENVRRGYMARGMPLR